MHRPRKRFGQNFLRDRHVLDRIITAAELCPSDHVLEVGPGPGALTERLLMSGADLLAVEIDRDLAASLRDRSEEHLKVIEGDVLRLDWREMLDQPPYKMVANLPYNISSQILFKVLDHFDLFSRLVLMFQREVGERLLAAPATRDYGILTVLVQTWYDVSRVVKVSPKAFVPPPKVDSVVLLLTPLERPRVGLVDVAIYRTVVRGAFAQRRKTLRNSLLGSGWSAAQIDPAFHSANIDPSRRGETLTLEEFASLANCLADQKQED